MASSNTPKQLEKISADCPHCGFSQLESAYAKSTFCRKCGEHFSIEKLLLKEATSLKGPSFFDKLSKLISREKIQTVTCFSCNATQQVSTEAQSTSCAQCGSYIDLREFKIDGPFGRSIQTQGEVIITPKGDVASSRIACGSAYIEGKFKGTLFCTGIARVRMKGKFVGAVESEALVIEKKSEVEFVRSVKVRSLEINGKTIAHVECDGRVTINKGGSLEGSIHARAITIEKGGSFSGDLSIGMPNAEGMPEVEAIPEAEQAAEAAEGEPEQSPEPTVDPEEHAASEA